MSYVPSDLEILGLPRPVLAYAVMDDGSRVTIDGWIQHRRESLTKALTRTAKEMGGVSVEIELTSI